MAEETGVLSKLIDLFKYAKNARIFTTINFNCRCSVQQVLSSVGEDHTPLPQYLMELVSCVSNAISSAVNTPQCGQSVCYPTN